jgi:diadenosine tetraphosphate (Ap4A) HIT family hydrolase
MNPFTLDDRLARDTLPLGESRTSLLRLMDNALVPWLVLVPRTDRRELFELEPALKAAVWAEIDALSRFLKGAFPADKLNVAAIGNLVPQLHIHLVARTRDDFAWPGVVWGRPERLPYPPAEARRVRLLAAERLGGLFRFGAPSPGRP